MNSQDDRPAPPLKTPSIPLMDTSFTYLSSVPISPLYAPHVRPPPSFFQSFTPVPDRITTAQHIASVVLAGLNALTLPASIVVIFKIFQVFEVYLSKFPEPTQAVPVSSQNTINNDTWPYILALLGIAFVALIAGTVQAATAELASERQSRHLRELFIRSVYSLPAGYLDQFTPESLLSLINVNNPLNGQPIQPILDGAMQHHGRNGDDLTEIKVCLVQYKV